LIIENCNIICVFCLHCIIGVIKVCSNGCAVKINFILLLVNINFIKFWFGMSEGFKLMTGTWDNLVIVVTMWEDDKVLIIGRVGDFCLCHHIHTGPMTCQGLYKTSIRGLSLGHEVCRCHLSGVVSFKNVWSCTFFPHMW
jgi:hypothetical protein